MATYTIHLPPPGMPQRAALERARFIKDGPSLMALVLPALWLIWHRLWYALSVYLVLALALALWARMADSAAPALLSVFPALYVFLEGRELVRRRLERAGWRFAGVVEGDDRFEAELRYFARRMGPQSTPPAGPSASSRQAVPADAAARPLSDEGPGIGIFAQ